MLILEHLNESYNFSLQNLHGILTAEFKGDAKCVCSYVFLVFLPTLTQWGRKKINRKQKLVLITLLIRSDGN